LTDSLLDRIERGITAMLDEIEQPPATASPQEETEKTGATEKIAPVVSFHDRLKAFDLAMKFAEMRGKSAPPPEKKAGIDALREQLNSPPPSSRRGAKPSARSEAATAAGLVATPADFLDPARTN